MTNKYTHLQKVAVTEFDWKNNLLKKSLPVRAFTNNLTSGLILSCQTILVESMKPIERLERWFSLK